MAKEKMSLGQLVDILAVLWKMLVGGEVVWDVVPCETAQNVLKADKKWLAEQFVKFLANGFRFVLGGLKVACAPFDPAGFIGKGWAFWKGPKDGKGLEGEEERDKTALALVEVDFDADYLTCLEEGESSITGEEKLIRLRKLGRPLYGLAQFMGLWLDYQLCRDKSQSKLELLYQQKGITWIDFFGDILRYPNGNRCVWWLAGRWWHVELERQLARR